MPKFLVVVGCFSKIYARRTAVQLAAGSQVVVLRSERFFGRQGHSRLLKAAVLPREGKLWLLPAAHTSLRAIHRTSLMARIWPFPFFTLRNLARKYLHATAKAASWRCKDASTRQPPAEKLGAS
jgi:hypothetical protein